MSKIGTITRVQTDSENNVIRVDVSITPTREHEGIPFRMPAAGMWIVPEVGDSVEVTRVDERQYVAHSPLLSSRAALPEGVSGGDIIIQLDDSTRLSLRQQTDGTYNINLNCDGDLNIDAGNIYVGEDGNRKRVLTEDAVFQYEQRIDTGDGTGGTTTKTTSTVSNVEITDTEVE